MDQSHIDQHFIFQEDFCQLAVLFVVEAGLEFLQHLNDAVFLFENFGCCDLPIGDVALPAWMLLEKIIAEQINALAIKPSVSAHHYLLVGGLGFFASQEEPARMPEAIQNAPSVRTQTITLMALLVACSAALQLMPTLPGTYALKFNGFPIILSGFLLGPVGGFWTGALADVMSFLMKPGGPFIPLFTLTSGLAGALPCSLYLILTRKDAQGRLPLSPLNLLLAIGLSQWLTKVFLVAFFRSLVFGIAWKALALQATAEQLLHAPLYAYFGWMILRRWRVMSARDSGLGGLRWSTPAAGDGPSHSLPVHRSR